MRFIVFLFMFLSSLSSLAGVTLELVSGSYKIKATMVANQNDPLNGTVSACTQANGECIGTFNLNFNNNTLVVSLVNQDDVGIGDCACESMVVNIDKESYQKLIGGSEISVTFNSKMFSDQVKNAVVRRLDRTR
jgi:hypothetical protein